MKCILNSKLADSPKVDSNMSISITMVVNISLSLDAYPQQTGFLWISHYRCITIRKSLPGLRKKVKHEIQRSNARRVFILMWNCFENSSQR